MNLHSTVSIMVRTIDLEMFKKNISKDYKKAFSSDCIKNSVKFDKYKSYLEYQLMDSDKVVSEDTDLTLITFNCVKWSDELDYVKAVWCFLNALDYFEMLIINDDYTTEFTQMTIQESM